MHPDVDRLAGEIVIYDTEYTSWEGSMERGWSGQNEYRELIQIAAIRVDASNGFSEIEELDIFVKPQRNPILSDYISSLTEITQRQIDDFGVHPETALRLFGNFCGNTAAWSYGRDDLILQENRALISSCTPAHAGGFGDLRPGLADAGISTVDRTSGTLHKAVGVCMQGQVHNALFDVRSIIACLRVLRDIGRI